ncbi:unnamed protein product, partial [Ectocarpus sp. 12 AP-2014]
RTHGYDVACVRGLKTPRNKVCLDLAKYCGSFCRERSGPSRARSTALICVADVFLRTTQQIQQQASIQHLAGPQGDIISMGSFTLPVVSEEELVPVSVTCVVAGIGLCFFSYRKQLTVVSAVSGLLFGLFCVNEILPQF